MLKQFEIIIENCGQKKKKIFITGGITNKKEYKNDNLETNKIQFGTYISRIQNFRWRAIRMFNNKFNLITNYLCFT